MRRKRRPNVNVAERVLPTPETAAKLAPDPIRLLHEAGKLTDADVAAAQEINRIWCALTAGLLARANRMEEGKGRGEIPHGVATAHAERYLPWVRAIACWERRARQPLLGLFMDTIIDAHPVPRRLIRPFGWALEEYHSPGALVRRVAWSRRRPIVV